MPTAEQEDSVMQLPDTDLSMVSAKPGGGVDGAPPKAGVNERPLRRIVLRWLR